MAVQGNSSENGYFISPSGLGCPITTSPFSFSAWVYLASSHGDGGVLSFTDASSGSFTNFLYVPQASNNFIDMYVGGFNDRVDLAQIIYDDWNFYFYSINSAGTSRLSILNGNQKTYSTGTRTLSANLDRWGIGVLADSTPSYGFNQNMRIADVAVWDDELSAEEGSLLYDSKMSPLLVRPENLVAYAPLNDDTDITREVMNGRYLESAGAGSMTLVDNPPLRYLRRSFSGFTPGIYIPPPPQKFRSLFRGVAF